MEKYEQISIVGEGSYGLVMKCRHKETDTIVAVKKFLETEEDAIIRKMALREIRMLKRLKHENLVAMIEVFRHRKRFYLVFEYLEGTVLDELEKMPGGLGDERCRERIFQVTRAISYCHCNHIIHRDVKPENVLVSSLGVVKLCDFGFARIINLSGEPCTEYVATRWYRAPELLVGEASYGPAVDVWAIGCLFAEMMTGDPLFPGESDIDQLYLIVKMLGKPCLKHQQLMLKNTQLRGMIKSPANIDESLYKHFSSWSIQAIDFLNGCMRMDPQHRLTSDELLKHSYFTHDRFPQRFLPALREKVNIEFNNPLLRKLKTEILMSTDKKDESKYSSRKQVMPTDSSRWRMNLGEGTMKRKLSCDTYSVGSEIQLDNKEQNKNLITLAKSSQRLNIVQRTPVTKQNSKEKSGKQQQTATANVEMQMLEKSLESLAKLNTKDETSRSCCSAHQKDLNSETVTDDSPLPFQSLHVGYGDCTKSPNFHTVLHPSINNISFNKDLPKRSPNLLQSLNGANKTNQVPLLSHPPRPQFLKKLDRNVVMENIFANGDQGNLNTTPIWLNSFSSSLHRKKDSVAKKNDDFSLPNLPGATTSPNKPKKKSLPEIEPIHSTEVTPRVHSASSSKTPPPLKIQNL